MVSQVERERHEAWVMLKAEEGMGVVGRQGEMEGWCYDRVVVSVRKKVRE